MRALWNCRDSYAVASDRFDFSSSRRVSHDDFNIDAVAQCHVWHRPSDEKDALRAVKKEDGLGGQLNGEGDPVAFLYTYKLGFAFY